MKKSLLLIFILVLSLVFVACATDNQNDELNEQEPLAENPISEDEEIDEEIDEEEILAADEDEEKEEENQVVDPTPETYSKTVTLYFVSKDYIMTGDETVEIMLKEEREIQYSDSTSLEEAVVIALMDGPEDSDTMSTLIPDSVSLSSVEVEDGTAFVDFDSEGLGGSSMQEMFTISQIVDSLLELGTVERVQFLIDGQKSESLMGHVGIIDPFTGE